MSESDTTYLEIRYGACEPPDGISRPDWQCVITPSLYSITLDEDIKQLAIASRSRQIAFHYFQRAMNARGIIGSCRDMQSALNLSEAIAQSTVRNQSDDKVLVVKAERTFAPQSETGTAGLWVVPHIDTDEVSCRVISGSGLDWTRLPITEEGAQAWEQETRAALDIHRRMIDPLKKFRLDLDAELTARGMTMSALSDEEREELSERMRKMIEGELGEGMARPPLEVVDRVVDGEIQERAQAHMHRGLQLTRERIWQEDTDFEDEPRGQCSTDEDDDPEPRKPSRRPIAPIGVGRPSASSGPLRADQSWQQPSGHPEDADQLRQSVRVPSFVGGTAGAADGLVPSASSTSGLRKDDLPQSERTPSPEDTRASGVAPVKASRHEHLFKAWLERQAKPSSFQDSFVRSNRSIVSPQVGSAAPSSHRGVLAPGESSQAADPKRAGGVTLEPDKSNNWADVVRRPAPKSADLQGAAPSEGQNVLTNVDSDKDTVTTKDEFPSRSGDDQIGEDVHEALGPGAGAITSSAGPSRSSSLTWASIVKDKIHAPLLNASSAAGTGRAPQAAASVADASASRGDEESRLADALSSFHVGTKDSATDEAAPVDVTASVQDAFNESAPPGALTTTSGGPTISPTATFASLFSAAGSLSAEPETWSKPDPPREKAVLTLRRKRTGDSAR